MQALCIAAGSVAFVFAVGTALRPTGTALSFLAAALLGSVAILLGSSALPYGNFSAWTPEPRLGLLALASVSAFLLSLHVTKLDTEHRRSRWYSLILILPAVLSDLGSRLHGFPIAALIAAESVSAAIIVLCMALSIVHVFRYHFPDDMSGLAWTVLAASITGFAALSAGTAGMILGDRRLVSAMDAVLSAMVLAGSIFSFRRPGSVERFRSETVTRRYARSVLSGMDVPEMIQGATDLMRRTELFRRSDCSLDELARRMGLTRHQVSELLNDRMGTSFAAFVNGFRVETAKALLASRPDMTILSIALEVGFGNKTSFNEAFRKAAGCTPSEYRKNSST